jgi:hypothetical protein
MRLAGVSFKACCESVTTLSGGHQTSGILPSVDLADSETLVGQLEKSPERVQFWHGKLEKLIAWTTDETCWLAKARTGSDGGSWG